MYELTGILPVISFLNEETVTGFDSYIGLIVNYGGEEKIISNYYVTSFEKIHEEYYQTKNVTDWTKHN